jgi:hypothetical protein
MVRHGYRKHLINFKLTSVWSRLLVLSYFDRKNKVSCQLRNVFRPICYEFAGPTTTNTVWVHARLCKLQKGCTRLAAASDKAYQLLIVSGSLH